MGKVTRRRRSPGASPLRGVLLDPLGERIFVKAGVLAHVVPSLSSGWCRGTVGGKVLPRGEAIDAQESPRSPIDVLQRHVIGLHLRLRVDFIEDRSKLPAV